MSYEATHPEQAPTRLYAVANIADAAACATVGLGFIAFADTVNITQPIDMNVIGWGLILLASVLLTLALTDRQSLILAPLGRTRPNIAAEIIYGMLGVAGIIVSICDGFLAGVFWSLAWILTGLASSAASRLSKTDATNN